MRFFVVMLGFNSGGVFLLALWTNCWSVMISDVVRQHLLSFKLDLAFIALGSCVAVTLLHVVYQIWLRNELVIAVFTRKILILLLQVLLHVHFQQLGSLHFNGTNFACLGFHYFYLGLLRVCWPDRGSSRKAGSSQIGMIILKVSVEFASRFKCRWTKLALENWLIHWRFV